MKAGLAGVEPGSSGSSSWPVGVSGFAKCYSTQPVSVELMRYHCFGQGYV